MVKKLDNRGLSLVELIIAIAMSTIVLGAVLSFLYGAEKSYRTAEYTVNLQMEAQLLMEQMSNWVMESNHIEVGGAVDGKNYLVLYQLPRSTVNDSDLTRVPVAASRKIIYLYDDKLYIKTDTEATIGEYIQEIKNKTLNTDFLTTAPPEENCIGEYVFAFTAKVPDGVAEDKVNSVDVTMELYEGVTAQSSSYSISDRFSLRNVVYVIETE